MRSRTVEQVAADLGIAAGTLGAAETGKRYVDGHLARAIATILDATVGECNRLADGMATSALEGAEVRYDLVPISPAGHRSSALLSIYSARLGPETWNAISALVAADVAARSETLEAAA